MARTADEYKQLSIREFTKAAKVYESGHAGIYEMCKDDYPQMLARLAGHGDVHILKQSQFRAMAEEAGLSVLAMEAQKGWRAHLVARK